MHDRVGYDPLAQAASGWLAMNGDPEGGPTKAPTFLTDDLSGLHGAIGAMAALHHRDRTGVRAGGLCPPIAREEAGP